MQRNQEAIAKMEAQNRTLKDQRELALPERNMLYVAPRDIPPEAETGFQARLDNALSLRRLLLLHSLLAFFCFGCSPYPFIPSPTCASIKIMHAIPNP